MLRRLAAIAFVLLVQPAYAETDTFVVGPAAEYSAGTYSFNASPISFQGHKLGYASADYKPQKFSSNYWVYLSCVMPRKEPGFDGECVHWTILNTQTRQIIKLEPPGFDSFWSAPAFSWPYIAYVDTGKDLGKDKRDVQCVLFDYRKKSIVRRQWQSISADSFATDFPHMFTPPAIREKNGTTSFSFGFDDAGHRKVICELSVP